MTGKWSGTKDRRWRLTISRRTKDTERPCRCIDGRERKHFPDDHKICKAQSRSTFGTGDSDSLEERVWRGTKTDCYVFWKPMGTGVQRTNLQACPSEMSFDGKVQPHSARVEREGTLVIGRQSPS